MKANLIKCISIVSFAFLSACSACDTIRMAKQASNMEHSWTIYNNRPDFVDFDFRPLDVEFSPMVGAKVGASYMMSDSPYENTLAPYVEINTGLNWFFRYVYRNMERNYLSLYLELAFAYTQQTCFLPVRLGIRL